MATMYRDTLLIKQLTPLGPYRRPVPSVLGGCVGGGRFLMGEVPLNSLPCRPFKTRTVMRAAERTLPAVQKAMGYRGYRGTSLIEKAPHPLIPTRRP